jgi:hypothetical protein
MKLRYRLNTNFFGDYFLVMNWLHPGVKEHEDAARKQPARLSGQQKNEKIR